MCSGIDTHCQAANNDASSAAYELSEPTCTLLTRNARFSATDNRNTETNPQDVRVARYEQPFGRKFPFDIIQRSNEFFAGHLNTERLHWQSTMKALISAQIQNCS